MKATQSKPHAIIFDWDNTLVHSAGATLTAYNRFLERIGEPTVTLEQVLCAPQLSVRQLFSLKFGTQWEEMMRLYYEELSTVHLADLKALPFVENLLDKVAENNVYMAIISNKHGDILRKEVQHLGWNSYFCSILGALDLPEDKPSVLPVQETFKKLQVKPEESVWFVGDSPIDYQCAVGAGCVPIIFSGPTWPEPPVSDAYIFPNPNALLQYFQVLMAC